MFAKLLIYNLCGQIIYFISFYFTYKDMKLISFDVGIKNMAYCIFQIAPGSPSSILDWNVLNLLEKDAPQNSCNCYLKAKNKKTPPALCGRVAKFSKGSTYFCDKHAKTNTDYCIPTKQTSPSYFNKMK